MKQQTGDKLTWRHSRAVEVRVQEVDLVRVNPGRNDAAVGVVRDEVVGQRPSLIFERPRANDLLGGKPPLANRCTRHVARDQRLGLSSGLRRASAICTMTQS